MPPAPSSAASSATDILKQLRAGHYAPVYLLQGDEPFEIDRVSDFIEAHALPEHEKGFNQVVLYGRDVDVATVVGNARRFPMMADRVVVVVREAQAMLDLEKEPGSKLLIRYLEKPSPTTVLVLALKGRSLDGRKPLAKAAAQHATVLTTKKLYDNQVGPWLSAYVREHQVPITPGAVLLLVERAGADLARLAGEVDKLLAGQPPGKPIDEETVFQKVGLNREFNVFELQSALVQHQGARVEQIIRFFESHPKDHSVIPMIGLLFGYFARLLVLHQQQAVGPIDWKAALGKRAFVPGVQREYELAVQRFPPDRARRVIGYLRRADLQAKGIEGGTLTDADILRDLVQGILRG